MKLISPVLYSKWWVDLHQIPTTVLISPSATFDGPCFQLMETFYGYFKCMVLVERGLFYMSGTSTGNSVNTYVYEQLAT